nr:MAG TPA: hypothetical protein [Bacteriophage sp.]
MISSFNSPVVFFSSKVCDSSEAISFFYIVNYH